MADDVGRPGGVLSQMACRWWRSDFLQAGKQTAAQSMAAEISTGSTGAGALQLTECAHKSCDVQVPAQAGWVDREATRGACSVSPGRQQSYLP